MPNLRLTPTLTPEGNRFKRPWSDTSRTPRVPLWTASPEGDEREGRFRVPLRLCHTKEHTNERLEFNGLVNAMLARWTTWLDQRGWKMTTKPIVKGPFMLPEAPSAKRHFERVTQVIGAPSNLSPVTSFESSEEFREYRVFARFKREQPLFVRLEDVLAKRDLTALYANETETDSGWVNPLEYAEQRRQRLGLKREDYLFSPLNEPL